MRTIVAVTTFRSYTRRPRTSATRPLTAAAVAKAYRFPEGVTGKGYTAGVIELGGGYDPAQFPHVTAVPVAGGSNTPDGANGADGEVQLDLEVISQVAPGAAIHCYFAPNTDAGFLAAIHQAIGECDVISISWGQAETQWTRQSLTAFDAAFKGARALGVTVFAAAGDSGADDSTTGPVTDFPASSPNVVGCGGTRLTLNPDGTRASEVTWNDNPASSATGGGLSHVFPGRQVPDVAGNADPQTGYEVTIDGGRYVIGGTSAVAPLYAGLALLLSEALGERVGRRVDFLNAIVSNPTVCYDILAGDNGAYRAGPGRDQVTGFGVVDGQRLLAAMQGGGIAPTPTPGPAPGPSLHWTAASADDARTVQAFTTSPTGTRSSKAKAALARGSWS